MPFFQGEENKVIGDVCHLVNIYHQTLTKLGKVFKNFYLPNHKAV